MLRKKLRNVERSIDQNTRQTPDIESDDISVALGERRQNLGKGKALRVLANSP